MKIKLISIAASLMSISAFATNAHATHSWGGYHWGRTTNPFILKLGDNVSTAWDGYLAGASIDWSVSWVLDATIVPGQTDSKKGNCRPTIGRVEVCNSSYGSNGWLGVAQVWVSDSHITQGAVKLNDTYFNTAKYNTSAWRRLVICQEVGHTFGLDHQDVSLSNANLGTCMDYTNDPDGTLANPDQLSNEHPNKHDYDELGLIYAHPDSVTTVGQTVSQPQANGNAAEAADDAGKVLRKNSKGRPILSARDLGNGKQLFTFIFWAE